MKKLSLSLIAAAMMTSAAVADISIKNVGGEAKLFYGTNDANDGDFFNKGQSYGNAAVNLNGASSVGSCATCTTLNWGLTGVSTMGLEHTLVGSTWINHTLDDAIWINLAFHPLDGISNTTLVLGRQALDTPMVFTEKWNIAKNTYDAAVAVNNDIVDTTLVGAWVGRSNVKGGSATPSGLPATVNATAGFSDNSFNTFLTNEGAYAFGAVTKAIPMVTAQAWYYIAPKLANVAWGQADTNFMGFTLGGQYVYTDPQAAGSKTGSGYAAKIGYNYEGLGLSAAYSDMDKDLMTAANLGGLQSKLYTEAWWNYGQVSQKDTTAFNVSATYDVPEIASLGLYYTNADHNTDPDMTEIAVTAGHDFDNLNITAAYVNTDIDGQKDATNDIQVYATYKF